jgi:NADPH:quinone reductase-like Zn-dependent oxidoreductase
MRRAIFHRHGTPWEVIDIITEADPLPGPKQVRVRNKVMTTAPNPSPCLQHPALALGASWMPSARV